MSYFSRLSDIVSCKLDDLLTEAGDPAAAMARIVSEIEEGLAGARRSVAAAASAEQRLQGELADRGTQVTYWGDKARAELAAGHEESARQALFRKRESDDLLAGLRQQLAAATSTREHLSTTLRAIEARLAEARRRQDDLIATGKLVRTGMPLEIGPVSVSTPYDRSRMEQVEADLEALRRELGR